MNPEKKFPLILGIVGGAVLVVAFYTDNWKLGVSGLVPFLMAFIIDAEIGARK